MALEQEGSLELLLRLALRPAFWRDTASGLRAFDATIGELDDDSGAELLVAATIGLTRSGHHVPPTELAAVLFVTAVRSRFVTPSRVALLVMAGRRACAMSDTPDPFDSLVLHLLAQVAGDESSRIELVTRLLSELPEEDRVRATEVMLRAQR